MNLFDPHNGSGLDPIDFLLEQQIRERYQSEELDLLRFAAEMKVDPERVKGAASRVFKLACTDTITDEQGRRWGKIRVLKERYGITRQNRRNFDLLLEKKGKSPVRSFIARTYDNPFNGETFYCFKDIERESLIYARRGELVDQRQQDENPEIARKPGDLSEYENAVLLMLLKAAVAQELPMTVSEMAERLGYKPSTEKHVRLRIQALKDKGYLDYWLLNPSTGPYEFRFLRGPEVYLSQLRQVDPELTLPLPQVPEDLSVWGFKLNRLLERLVLSGVKIQSRKQLAQRLTVGTKYVAELLTKLEEKGYLQFRITGGGASVQYHFRFLKSGEQVANQLQELDANLTQPFEKEADV